MEWTNDNVLTLIDAYRVCPLLWDPLHPFYKNRLKRKEAIESIALTMNVTSKEVERKLHNIRGQFQREKRKLQQLGSVDSIENCRWFAYKHLDFLMNLNPPRQVPDYMEFLPNVKEEEEEEYDEVLIEDEMEEDYENETPPTITGVDIDALTYPRTSSKRECDLPLPLEASKRTKYAQEVTPRDECSVYGEHIVMKLRKIKNPTAMSIIQHLINTALFEAQLGLYDDASNPRGLAANVMPKYGYTSQPSSSSS